jgi:hypothetical protein
MTGGLHDRSLTSDAFYEWLLSDHPYARAERDWRRAATHQADTGGAAAVRAWADKINAQPDAPHTPRDLAASMGPQADQSAVRAQASYAEPDDAYVARLRTQHETSMRVSGPPGSWDYRYPAHLTGRGPAVITVRLMGAATDCGALAAILARQHAVEILTGPDGPYPNRRGPGHRLYLTVWLATPATRPDTGRTHHDQS